MLRTEVLETIQTHIVYSIALFSKFVSFMRNVADGSCRDNQNTHCIFNSFVLEIRVVYEKMCKNIVERGRPQMKIWHTNIAHWITKATNIQSEYVILIAFPLQLFLAKRVSVLLYMNIACLVAPLFEPFVSQIWFKVSL
jgi:hypothetical protein